MNHHEIYRTALSMTLLVLGMQRYYREKVLKGKIDSFDTKRERSAISHFHGYNLYTTSKGINIFLGIYNIISINIIQTIKYQNFSNRLSSKHEPTVYLKLLGK